MKCFRPTGTPSTHAAGIILFALLGSSSSSLAQFTDIASAPPLNDGGNGFGIAWGDYDGDGDQDLYLVNQASSNKLMRNDGAGVFSDVTAAPLNVSTTGRGVAWADNDNDGDLDLYVANVGANKLFRNDGGSFADVSAPPVNDAGTGRAAVWGDFNNDENVDLYHTREAENLLFRNNGGGSFSDVTAPPVDDPSNSFGADWGDFDNDGDLDLYVAHGNLQSNMLFRNDGNGSFADVTSAPLNDTGDGRGAAWGDYDNDRDLDLYIANFASGQSKLFRNDGAGTFADVTAPPLNGSGNAFSPAWADYDNDADLDLYVTNSGSANQLFRNNGGSFADVSAPPVNDAGTSRAAAWADIDADGDLDLYLVNNGANRLFRNNSPGTNRWLHVNLRGTLSNRAAIGARVRAVTGSLSQIRDVSGGSGLYAQNSLTVEFGLGAQTSVDSLIISWPSGVEQVRTAIAANQVLSITEGVDVGNQFVCGIGSTIVVPTAKSDSLVVPVTIRGVSSALDNLGFQLTFDPDVFTCAAVRRGHFISFPWSFSGTCHVGAAQVSASGVARTPNDPDTLAYVVLLVDPLASGSASVTTTNFTGDFAAGALNAADCSATISFDPHGTGDVNNDLELTPGDALCAFRCGMSLNGDVPSSCLAGTGFERNAADIDCNSNCSPGDALIIFERYLCDQPPAHCAGAGADPSCLSVLRMELARPRVEAIRLGTLEVAQGELAEIPVEAIGSGTLRAFRVDLVSPQGLEVTHFARSPSTESWAGIGEGHGPEGMLRIGGFDVRGLTLDPNRWTALGTLHARASESAAGVSEWKLLAATDETEGLRLEPSEVRFTPGDLPLEFALLSTRPNPFQESVTVEYLVPAGANLALDIRVFDIRGRAVRNVVDRVQGAGRHRAFWAGDDDNGNRVGSGIYFVRMRAGSFEATRKIILAR
jgi:hypothetical protein